MAHLLLEFLRSASIHIRRHRTRIDSINSRSLRELSRPRPRHRLQRRLGAAVNALVLKPERRADAADIDNASAAVVREIGQHGFHEEQRTADVDVVERREIRRVAVLNRQVARDARVLHDDVDLQLAALGVLEVVRGHVDDVRGAVFSAQVGLHGKAFHAVGLLQSLGELLRFLGRGVGCVVDD